MAESIRCPHCGKSYVMKPELVGKQVRCRQCQKAFAVPAVVLPVDEDEPVTLSLAPEPAPAVARVRSNAPVQNWAAGPAIAPPGQADMLAVGSVLPLHGQSVLGTIPVRGRSQAGPTVWQRLQQRKLTTAVAVVSVGLLLLSFLLLFVGLPFLFVVPSLAGVGLAGLGLWLPVPKRRNRRGPWLLPPAARIATGSAVFGFILAIVFGIFVAAGMSGHPIPAALGMAQDSALILVGGIFWGSGLCFAVCFVTIGVSIAWGFVSKFGFMPVANTLYLVASPLLLLVLCVCAAVSRGLRHDPNFARQPPGQSINRDTGMPPGWSPNQYPPGQTPSYTPPRHPMPTDWPPSETPSSQIPSNQTPPSQMPPEAERMRQRGMPMGPGRMRSMGPNAFPPGFANPNDPEFYRTMLSDLKSSDVTRRRIAVMRLAHAEPKELREEITKALEPLVNDSDTMLKAGSLQALAVWSTGDVVPLALRALQDDSPLVRNGAFEVLEKRKDARAIEPLLALLSSDSSGWPAVRCLEEMGSMVEDAVLARYDSGNTDTKRKLIQILETVATQKGIAKLRQIAADKSDFAMAAAARHALYGRGERVTD